jgi:hypothetical protein
MKDSRLYEGKRRLKAVVVAVEILGVRREDILIPKT